MPVAFYGYSHRPLSALNLPGDDVFPIRIIFPVQPDDLVPGLNPCLRSRRGWHHMANDRAALVDDPLERDHVQASQHSDREHYIHERARCRNDESLPPRLVPDVAGIRTNIWRLRRFHFGRPCRLQGLHGLLPSNLHVSPEQDQRETVIRIAPFEAEQTRAKSEAEHVYANIENTRGP